MPPVADQTMISRSQASMANSTRTIALCSDHLELVWVAKRVLRIMQANKLTSKLNNFYIRFLKTRKISWSRPSAQQEGGRQLLLH
jgi:hypothetical protein